MGPQDPTATDALAATLAWLHAGDTLTSVRVPIVAPQ
jgi:hypothetical protein